MRARIAVAFASLTLAACVKSPPVQHPRTVAAPAVPPLAAAPDGQIFAWLRAHQIVRTLERIGAGSMVKKVARQGIDPGQIDPERPAVVIAGDPAAGVGKTPLSALVPVAPQSQIGAMLQALLGGDKVIALDGQVALALNRPPLDSAASELLRTLQQAPLEGDLELVVNVEAFTRRFADVIKRALDKMRESMLKPQPTGASLEPALVDAYVGWIRDWIDDQRLFTIGFGAGEHDLNLYTVSRDKSAPATPPARATEMVALGPFVPVGDVRMEMAGRGWKRWRDGLLTAYKGMFKDAPDVYARLKAVVDEFARGESSGAMSMQLDSQHFLRASVVVLSDNAEKQFEAMRAAVAVVNQEAVRKQLTQGGLELSLKSQQAVRKVEGWPVDRFTYNAKLDESKLKPGQRDLFRRMFPMEMEVGRFGSYLVYTVNQPSGALDKMVAELMTGKGSAPPLEARRTQPAGGWLYGDIAVPQLVRDLGLLLPEKLAPEVTQLDASIPAVSFFGYGTEGLGYFRVQVPARLVEAIRDAANRKKVRRTL